MINRIKYAVIGLMALGLTSCEIVGGIFKAGMYWAFFLVFALVALILYLVMKSKGSK